MSGGGGEMQRRAGVETVARRAIDARRVAVEQQTRGREVAVHARDVQRRAASRVVAVARRRVQQQQASDGIEATRRCGV